MAKTKTIKKRPISNHQEDGLKKKQIDDFFNY